MSAASDILIAATDLDDRWLDCLADCRATFVRTFDEAQRALRECLFKMIVIDLNFDDVRMFDLLQYVRSRAAFSRVPVVCVQGSDPGAGFGAALDRLVKMLGGKAFVDLRGDEEAAARALERLCRVVGAELGMLAHSSPRVDARREPAELCGAKAQRLCVLIIDHDVDAAHRLAEMIEEAGHDADLAYGAEAGLEAVRHLRPDVVFIDLALPQSDGHRLARRLREERGSRKSVLVALLPSMDEAQIQRVRQAGFDHHVVKPADAPSVRRLLEWRMNR